MILETEKDGVRTRTSIAAQPAGPVPFELPPIRAIAPARLRRESEDWRTVFRDGENLPLSLREPDDPLYTAPLENGGIYIRLNAIADGQKAPLADRLEGLLFRAPAEGWKWAVLDLRFNPGGDYTKTLFFTQALPYRIADTGQLWLLTSNTTFSAAIVTLARAKYFAGARARIVGEKIGDHDEFWAESGPRISLPDAGLTVDTATGMHNWVRGCTDATRCFWLNRAFGVAAGDLSPEVSIGWRFADYAAGRDTVLDKVRALEAAAH